MKMLTARQTLTLLNTKGVGTKTTLRAQRLTSGSVRELSELLNLLRRVKERHARTRVPDLEQLKSGRQTAEKILTECQSEGIRILVPEDEEYPCLLNEVEDRPPVLYRRGSAGPVQPAVAIVGTRSASRYGQRCAERLGEIFAETGFWIVSGLALGCDAAAHRGCLKVGGKTAAILAHGLDEVHPKENLTLARDILDEEGIVLSEHAPGTTPQSHQFAQRNRIQSGLSLGVIVVEADEESGTMHTARFAREQGRPLGALVPQQEEGRELQAGNGKLLNEGASPIADEEDIRNFINLLQENSKG